MATKIGVTDIFPLTPFQEGLIFHHLFDPAGPDLYAVQLCFDFEGELDPLALRAAADSLVRRHTALRAAFRQRRSGEPVQLIIRGVKASWSEVDLQGLGTQKVPGELDRLAAGERDRRFDLTQPQSIRFKLIRHGGRRSRLLITYHHILLDGWSMPILLQELFRLYARRGDDRDLAEPIPHRAYLSWLARQDAGRTRDAWRRELSGVTAPTLFAPADAARAPVLPLKHVMPLRPSLVAAVRAMTQRYGLTFNTVVQGAWAILLARLTGRDDICFGATVHCRPADLTGAETMIGSFINMITVRVPLPAAQPVAETLADLQDRQAELIPHQHFGMSEVQRMLGLPQVFDTVVTFENYPVDADVLAAPVAGLSTVGVQVHDSGHLPLRLAAMLVPSPRLQLDHRPGLLDPREAEVLAGRFIRLLDGIAANPEAAVGRLSVLAETERAQLLVQGRGAQRPAAFASLLGRIHAVAAAKPDSIAVVDDVAATTYSALCNRASALSGRLLTLGARPGDVVAVLADRGAPVIGAMLGVFGARGAYLPLEPLAPVRRNAALLADSGAAFLLAGPGYEGAAARIAAELAAPPQLVPPDAGENHARGLIAPAAADLAFVLYTSGSTGHPKGTLVAHRGMINHLLAKIGDLGITAADSVVQNAPLTFVVSVWQMLAALTVGGRVRVVGDDTARDPLALFQQVGQERLTIIEVVPSLLQAAMDAWDSGAPAGGLPGLRQLVVTGEALPANLAQRWLRRFPGIPLVNAYGSTECSDDVSHAVFTRALDIFGAIVPIGRAVQNTELYVLDNVLQPTPAGVAGELYVGGAGVGVGYLRNPAGTATRFVADPFCGRPGARMYRTGDLARWRPDGTLDFLGRTDDQVKIRGVRIELNEIECSLRSHPAVAQAAVTVRAGEHGSQRLVAYIVANAAGSGQNQARREHDQLSGSPGYGPGLRAGDLRGHLRARLPHYLIPDAYVFLDTLPLTPNGKLDRSALPEPDQPSTHVRAAPRTRREEILRDLFAEVLGCQQVGTDDDFFDLGGHSLLATRLISRVRAVLHAQLSVRAIFEAPTVAALAARIGAEPGTGVAAVLLPIRTEGQRPPLFCVHGQFGLSWQYRRLAGHLPAGTPIYGLQARGIFAPGKRPARLDDMAADYTAQIRRVQPEGPYQLLGWSCGGNIAHAMATRLQSEGADVALLAILDSYGPNWQRVAPADDEEQVLTGIAEFLGHPGEPGDRRHAMALLDAAYPGLHAEESTLTAFIDSAVNNRAIVRDFVPAAFRGNVLFFVASGGLGDPLGSTPSQMPRADQTWEGYVDGMIETHRVSCGHNDMLEERALAEIGPILSRRLNARAAGAQA